MDQKVSQFGPFSLSDVKQAFRAFDLDQNAFVGAAELRSVYSALGEEVTDDEIDEMIRMVDTDGDGQVSEAEFAKMIFRYAPQIPDKPTTKPASIMGAVASPTTPAAATATGTGVGAAGATAITTTATSAAGTTTAPTGSGDERKSARKPHKPTTDKHPQPHKGDGKSDGPAPSGSPRLGDEVAGDDKPQPLGSAATPNAAGATSGFAFSAAKVAEKTGGDLLSVMTSLSINPEQIKRLMAQFQEIGKVDDTHAGAAVDGDHKKVGGGGGDTRRKQRYLLNFARFCKLLGLEAPPQPPAGSAAAAAAAAPNNASSSSSTVYAERMFKLFDHDGSGLIDAKEFLIGLSAYADSTKDDKLKLPAPAMNISHITNDIKEQIAKFELHFEQYTNAEAAAADQIVAEHHHNVLQFREAEKNLKEKEAILRKAKEAEEYKLKDAMIRHAAARDEVNALTAKLAALPATLANVQQQQTQKNEQLQHKQLDIDKQRGVFGQRLQTLMSGVEMYSRRLGLSITTDARGLSFVFTHVDPRNPQRKCELLLGYDENKSIKILSTSPALDVSELDDTVDWSDISCFGYVVQWARQQFRQLAMQPPKPVVPSPAKTKTPSKAKSAAAAAEANAVSAAIATLSFDSKASSSSSSSSVAAAAVTTAAAAPAPAASAMSSSSSAAAPAAVAAAEPVMIATAPVEVVPSLAYPMP